ncbi:PadR family transcriptional regulator [Actinoplanes xinjiangensis]|uniref:PadR family transcriptional regulator n=1 Tax=Actinoplanes xinjiangensis TaxID=512350 RepID=A0A316FIW9_9ACTN|nr:PadR family transcriptional regulator [Actinoplanes xinjiangensis]PWK47740.1 PadR family transcriptional regulator [Actinoplanes xinjiangensis]GIF39326.1 PadR family transcriptional regulator [Actinoplanes xinjiangensis]
MDNTTALLGLLGAGASYGYDLKNSYDRWFGVKKPLALGQVYTTLARLIRYGWIEALGEEAGAGPDRKRYGITPAGRERVMEWMFTPEVPSETMQSNLFAKTIIALLLDDDAGRMLDLQRAQHMARMRHVTAEKKGAPLATVLVCDHALFHIEADLRWIDLTAARLGQLRAEMTR